MIHQVQHQPAGSSWPSSERQTRLVLFAISLVLYFWRRAPFLGQWDSFDYLKEIVGHQLSPLGFGRPVFVGCNIALWEIVRKILHLEVQQVESVVLSAVILTGAFGVFAFSRFARRMLSGEAAFMATIALALSPTYAFYAGCVMTEVPMLCAAVAAAYVLWNGDLRPRFVYDLTAGILWGVAIGIREQALVLFPAFLWILWVRRSGTRARLRSSLVFAASSFLMILFPVAVLYLKDPPAFMPRMRTWVAAIPTASSHFWMNVQASLLWTAAASPGAWLAVAGAWLWRLRSPKDSRPARPATGLSGPAAVSGILLCFVVPVATLWRDADVQIHPRYALIALPAASVLAAALYRRWAPSQRAVVVWAALQVLVFGAVQAGTQTFRHVQFEKRDYAHLVRDTLDGPALLIAGGNSAAFDYYRSIGLRPQWRIVWSGWDWSPERVRGAMQDAWDRGEAVYLCDGPATWLNLEGERLELEFLLKDCDKQTVAAGLKRILPKRIQSNHGFH